MTLRSLKPIPAMQDFNILLQSHRCPGHPVPNLLIYNQISNSEVKLKVWGGPKTPWGMWDPVPEGFLNLAPPCLLKVGLGHGAENSGSSSKSVWSQTFPSFCDSYHV